MKEKEHIVLDTNVLLMCIHPQSQYRCVWQAFLSEEYVLCVSNDILEEYSEVIARNINAKVADYILQVILLHDNVKLYDPHYRFNLIKADEDDNKFVDCAFAANAKCIVTEDHHFNVLNEIDFPRIEVVGIDLFCQTL